MPVGRIYEPPPRIISIKRGSFETEEFVKPSSKTRSIPIKIKVDVNNNTTPINKNNSNGALESTKSSTGNHNGNIIKNGLDNKDENSTVISIPITIIRDPSPTRATIKLTPVSSSIQERKHPSESISTSRPLNIPIIKKSVSPEPLENGKGSSSPETESSANTTPNGEISEKEICESEKSSSIIRNEKPEEEEAVEEDKERIEVEEEGLREDIIEDEVDENLMRRLGFIKTDHAKGLRNLGNTCFMNSTIQCLAHSIQLLELIQKDYFTNSEEESDLTDSFADVIKDLWSLSGRNSTRVTVDPTKFKGEIGRFAPKFSGYNQHDSQEFLQYLLEGIHNELNRVDSETRKKESKRIAEQSKEEEKTDSLLSPIEYGKKCFSTYLLRDNSFVTDLFMGQFRSTLKCLKCNNESVTFEPFWVVSLPIPPKSVQPKLEDCLRLFTKEEILDGDEKPTCEKVCKSRQKCSKWYTFERWPQILVVHFKRFESSRFRSKISHHIDVPVTSLNVGEFSSKPGNQFVSYDCFGISNHSGSLGGGHYTAYGRHPVYHSKWHLYNDSFVSKAGGDNVVSHEAYLLFFDKR